VCWDRNDRTFVYFHDPGNLHQVIDSSGFGPIDTWVGYPVQISHSPSAAVVPTMMPLVERAGPIPRAESTFAEPEVHVLFQSFWAENFGHALGDDIMPAFSLQSAFGLLTPDSVLMLPQNVGHPMCNPGELWQRARLLLNTLSTLISDHPITEIDIDAAYATTYHAGESNSTEYGIHCDESCRCFNKVPPPQAGRGADALRYVCFRNLLAGHSLLGLTGSPDGGLGLTAFSNYIIERAMRRWPSVEAASRPLAKQRLLIFEKTGRRRILNVQSLAEYLRGAFAVEVEVIRPGDLPLQDVIAKCISSSVILTPLGGISFNVAFARARSSVVFVTAWDAKHKAASGFERYIWEQVHRLTDFYYDVRLPEITVLPPGNVTHPSIADFRNHGSVTVDMARMGRIIVSALTSAEQELGIPAPSFSKHMNHIFRP
jgi:hypothetical protein